MNFATDRPREDDRIAAAVAEFLEAQDSGQPIGPIEWLARHSEIASELRESLDDAAGLVAALRAFRGAMREPDLTTTERFVGDYELLERIGGSMGVVYRARQRSLPREVAVKLLLKPGAGHRERFRRGRGDGPTRSPAHCPHPEVSRGGRAFFSMEWCPARLWRRGRRMADRTRRPSLSSGWPPRLIMAQAGVLHRDRNQRTF